MGAFLSVPEEPPAEPRPAQAHDLLFLDEEVWRDRYTWLQEKGYLLRKRYHPDWTPPWLSTGRLRRAYEDGHEPAVSSEAETIALARSCRIRHSTHSSWTLSAYGMMRW